jgi:hypothetical protein
MDAICFLVPASRSILLIFVGPDSLEGHLGNSFDQEREIPFDPTVLNPFDFQGESNGVPSAAPVFLLG